VLSFLLPFSFILHVFFPSSSECTASSGFGGTGSGSGAVSSELGVVLTGSASELVVVSRVVSSEIGALEPT
jgi:hypothetical protein